MAELLTVKEAAEYLRVNPQWLYLQIQSGRIPAIRLRGDKGPWRIDKARLQQWLEDQHFQVGEEAEAEAA